MPTFRRFELVALAVLAASTVALAWAMPRPPAFGLHGRYWINSDWSGAPVAEARDVMPTTSDLLARLPGARRAGSAEWTGFLLVRQAGQHSFETESDDGSWLTVDGELVVDNGGVHPSQTRAGSIQLTEGAHAIRVRYFQAGGGLSLRVHWTPPGGDRRPLPAGAVVMTESAARAGDALGAWQHAAVAVPVVWACLFLYFPVRLGFWFVWREVVKVTPRAPDRSVVLLVMGAGVVLMAWGLGWGLMGDLWAPDELPPAGVQDLIANRFAGGWHDKYPWMHFAVLAIPVSAFTVAGDALILASDSLASQAAQLTMMRIVSLVLCVGAIGALYVCGAELGGPRQGVLSALALVLTPLFAYYGKVANLDGAMLCWFGWAMVAFVRVCRYQRLADYVLLGVMAAAAVATKDQAYANLALLPIAVVWATARSKPHASRVMRYVAAIADRRVLAAGVSAVVSSLVLHNVVFNADGFVSHVRLLSTLGDIAVVPRTPAGYAELTALTARLVPFALGWPLAVLAGIGLVRTARQPDRRWWCWLLVVPLSFHLTFTWVTLYVNDRYLLGGLFVAALFAGSAASDLLALRRWRAVGLAAVAGALLYSALHAASIDLMMVADGRHAVREWVQAHAPAGAQVGVIGSYLPAIRPPLEEVPLPASVSAVRDAAPDFLLLNDRFAQRYRQQRSPEGRQLLDALADGSLGYTEVFRHRAAMPSWAILAASPEFTRRGESVLTNLDKVNPETVVYRRR